MTANRDETRRPGLTLKKGCAIGCSGVLAVLILLSAFYAFMYGLLMPWDEAAKVEHSVSMGFDEKLRRLIRNRSAYPPGDLPNMEAQYQLPPGWEVLEGSRFCTLLDEHDGRYGPALDAYRVDWETRYDLDDTGSWTWVIGSAAYNSSLCVEP